MKDIRCSLVKLILALVLVTGLMGVAPASIDAQDPVVNMAPSSGPIGTKVTVSICNMTPGRVVIVGNVTFNDEPWNDAELPVDSSGCMCATTLTVPVAPIGPNAVVVDDGVVRAIGVFTVTQPNISVSPTSGFKSEVLTVTGSGWHSPSIVTITFQGSMMKTVMPDSAGRFTTEFEVPLTAEATNIIGATDNIGNSGPAVIFTLKQAGLAVRPLNGLPGTLVQLTGWGFQPFSGVENVKIASYPLHTPGLITDSTGAFTTSFEAPGLPGGGYIVTATVAGLTLDTCFTVLEEDMWIPVEGDTPMPAEEALESISHQLIRVWGYYDGEWQMYDPADPLGSNLPGLISGRAYWIKVSGDCALIFRDLQAGWNNIGW